MEVFNTIKAYPILRVFTIFFLIIFSWRWYFRWAGFFLAHKKTPNPEHKTHDYCFLCGIKNNWNLLFFQTIKK